MKTVSIDGEKLIVLKGFMLNDEEVLISDCDKLGEFKQVRVLVEPSLVRHWEEEGYIEDLLFKVNKEK